MSTTTTNLGLTKPEKSDLYSCEVMANNMDIIDEKITALEAGEFESISADVGNFGKITTSQTLSYSGYYDVTISGHADANTGVTANNIVPVFMSSTPISGKVSAKTTNTAANLVVVSTSGLTSTVLTTTQTEYTVTNAINIYISCRMSNRSSATITLGIPSLV